MPGHLRLRAFIIAFLVIALSACMEIEVETSDVWIDPNITPPALIVYITDEYCPSFEARVGWTVTWINDGKEGHILRSEPLPDGRLLFDSGEFQPGDGHSVEFSEAGVILYRCSVDGTLTGTITVLP